MEIRFSDNWARDNAYPEGTIRFIVAGAGLCSRIKWADDSACRFTIAEHPSSTVLADHAAHDKVIRALLAIDPHAEIRTAKAIYRGLADWEKQNA